MKKVLKWFIKRYLDWFVNRGEVVMEERQMLQGDFRGLIVYLGVKLPIQAVTASREGWLK